MAKKIYTMRNLFREILLPERSFYFATAIYSIAATIFMLAIPISVQALINTVVNTKQQYFIFILATILFGVLVLTSIMLACREYIMELFQRRFFARITSEVTLRFIYADQDHIEKINRTELVNRFFEVMHVQKIIPNLMTNGVSSVLQIAVGIIVVSFYHPILMLFSMVFAVSVWLVWKIWAGRAIKSVLKLSNSKYDLVNWMEETARENQLFKSNHAIDECIKIMDEKIINYLKNKKKFFKYTFSQTISFLFLFSIVNPLLLGIGGVLVSKAQLSIGQLIGAEIIMSAVFYNLIRLGSYLSSFYELCASVDKLGYFYKIPSESLRGQVILNDNLGYDINANNILQKYRTHEFPFHMIIEHGQRVLIKPYETTASKVFCDLLQGHKKVQEGLLYVGNTAINDIDIFDLREKIKVIDNVLMIEATIRTYFKLADKAITNAEILGYLDMVGMKDTVSTLNNGLDTLLMPSGYPLLLEEIVLFKLALALAAKPKILVVTEAFDMVPLHRRLKVIKIIESILDMTFILFTNKSDIHCFDNFYYIDENCSHKMQSLKNLDAYIAVSDDRRSNEQ